MSSSDSAAAAPGKRRSRKSIAVMPTSAAATTTITTAATSSSSSAPEGGSGSREGRLNKKSRSKSLGPGGLLDAGSGGASASASASASAGDGLKSGSGNGRRESLAPAATVRSILKPTLPISPLKPIPSHRTRSARAPLPPFTMAPTNPTTKPAKAPATTTTTTTTSSSSSSSASALNFNPPPPTTTVPIRTEEEQQRRAEILAARAARRQSMGNRRVSFAPEATLHTWDVNEYYPGTAGTPASSSSGSSNASTPAANRGPGDLSTIEATPTETSLAADGTPVRLPEALGGSGGGGGLDPVTPMGAAQQKRSFESPVFSSSPFSSSPGSAFGGMAQGDDDAMDSGSGSGSESGSEDDDEEPGAGDRTFMTMGGDETMGEMTMDIADDDVTGGAGFGAFGKRKAWKLEGSTETVEDPAGDGEQKAAAEATTAPKEDEEEDEGGEMTMEMTRAVGGLLPSVVEYPALPVSKEDHEEEDHDDDDDDGGEMTMDMTRAIGGVLPPTFNNPYAEKDEDEDEDAGMDMTMDMTRPVGGILSSAANALQRATRKSLGFFTSAPTAPAPAAAPADEDGMAMDMTVALGGILSKAPEAAPEPPSSPPLGGDVTTMDMDMDMDMTRPVGGIISAAPAARFASSPAGSDVAENEEMTMEFTSVLGGIVGGEGAKAGGRRSSLARGGGAGKLMSGAEWARQQEARKSGDKADKQQEEEEEEDEDGEDGEEEGAGDMDFTMAVGGIISRQAEADVPASTFPGVNEDSDSEDDGDVDMDGVTMDITTAIGSILPPRTGKPDEWTPASIPATADEVQLEKEEEEAAKEITSSPTPAAKRGGLRGSSRRSTGSSASATASPRVTRSARKKTPDAPPPHAEGEKKKAAESSPAAQAGTPVQRRQTPTRRAATPKSKSTTPKNQGKRPADTSTPTPAPTLPASTKTETETETSVPEPAKPEFVFATPQKKTPTAPFTQPQTPPGQATPAIPPRPKTPSKHTPMIQTPLRQVSTHGGFFALSSKKPHPPSTFPTSPSPANRITTPRADMDAPGSPSTTRGVGINRPGLGSPRIAARLSARKSLAETTTLPSFSPLAAPRDLLMASRADEAADRALEMREREQEAERRKGLDLKSRIGLLTPRRAARKSFAYGALLQGKREREEEEEEEGEAGGSYRGGGGKRRKSFEGGVAAGRDFDFDKAPSLPALGQGQARTPRRKAVTIAPEVAMSSSPMAPPPKPVVVAAADEKMRESEEEKEEEEIEEEEEEEEEERITLQQFLSMTSISFLDGLTTTKRRPTGFPTLDLRRAAAARRRSSNSTGPEADEDPEPPLSDTVIAGACTVPMLELFQHACRELKHYIHEGRAIVRDIEHDTETDNPPLFREYRAAPPDVRVIMDAQFRNVKTHARLLARGIWYRWRRQLMLGVRAALDTHMGGMEGDEAALAAAGRAAEAVLPALRARHAAAEKAVGRLEGERRRVESDDQELLGRAREGLDRATARIEEVRARLAERAAELREVEARVGERGARREALRGAIVEAERVTELHRGWSGEEVAAWAARAEEVQRRSGWGVVGVHGGEVVELVFLRVLRVRWDAVGKAPACVEYVPEATRRPSDPLPLEGAERDFFVGALNARLAAAGGRTLKGTVAEVDAFWRRCLRVAAEIERVRGWYPVVVRAEAGRLCVAIKVLVAEVRSKVVIEVAVAGGDLGVTSAARVVYGGVNGEAVGEFVGRALVGAGGAEGGEWRSVVDGVVGRCVEGRRRGGVGVPTRA
ncbi:Spc7 kinetochore protein-domain-containing protein [Morchella snyderi]|nr:Spc7 kinetochore protein-domain-containing protein [Morchella snyderi]